MTGLQLLIFVLAPVLYVLGLGGLLISQLLSWRGSLLKPAGQHSTAARHTSGTEGRLPLTLDPISRT